MVPVIGRDKNPSCFLTFKSRLVGSKTLNSHESVNFYPMRCGGRETRLNPLLGTCMALQSGSLVLGGLLIGDRLGFSTP